MKFQQCCCHTCIEGSFTTPPSCSTNPLPPRSITRGRGEDLSSYFSERLCLWTESTMRARVSSAPNETSTQSTHRFPRRNSLNFSLRLSPCFDSGHPSLLPSGGIKKLVLPLVDARDIGETYGKMDLAFFHADRSPSGGIPSHIIVWLIM